MEREKGEGGKSECVSERERGGEKMIFLDPFPIFNSTQFTREREERERERGR